MHIPGLDFLDAEWLIRWFGPFVLLGVAAVVFIETGFLVLSFLPGDSLLFTVGLLTSTGFIHSSRLSMFRWMLLVTFRISVILISCSGLRVSCPTAAMISSACGSTAASVRLRCRST